MDRNVTGKHILDDQHCAVPCDDLITWAEWMCSHDPVVQQETIGDLLVSTVFLGTDRNFRSMFDAEADREPILFETMIFHDYPSSCYQRRCATWEQAQEMHRAACALVQSGGLLAIEDQREKELTEGLSILAGDSTDKAAFIRTALGLMKASHSPKRQS